MDGYVAATEVARWLRDSTAQNDVSLAYGSAGIALFFLRLHETLGHSEWLPDLDALVALDGPGGLYTGAAGIAYVLAEAYRVTGDERCATRALALAVRPETTGELDVFGGVAGTGLALLHLAAALDAPELAALAIESARNLARRTPESYELLNFAHGAAGVAYFLAATAAATGNGDLLTASVEVAAYLRSVSHDGKVPLHPRVPVYWAGWCHGTAGTLRLWSLLADLTGEETWSDTRDAAAATLLMPHEIGNEATRCCGSAGMAETLLDLYALTSDPAYLDGARHLVTHMTEWASRDAAGLRWRYGAAAPTGWLKGAAGTGHALLRWGAVERGTDITAAYPDSPFGRLVGAPR